MSSTQGRGHAFVPFLAEGVGLVGELHVHAADVVGDGEREAERLFRYTAPAIDGQHHDGLFDFGNSDGPVEIDLMGHAAIVAIDRAHQGNHEDYQERSDPGALNELGHQHHQGGDAGGDGAEPVYQHAAGVAAALPVHHHSRLRKSECHERADGIEGNKPVCYAAEDDEQNGGERHQHVDAPRVQQPPTAKEEDVGHVVIESNGAGEAGKISERGVGGKREDEQDRSDGEVIEPAVAHHRPGQHGEHALVSGAVGMGGGDTVSAAQERDAGQQNGQQGDDDGEGDLGVFAGGIAKRHHAVADGFNAGHGGAAGREDFEAAATIRRRQRRRRELRAAE